jgi:hypothetical protein
MAPRNPAALAALTLTLALGVSGCGGGDTEAKAGKATASASSTPSASPTATATDTPVAPITPVDGLPTDFPTDDVPLLSGPVSQPLGAGSSGEEGHKGWVLQLELAKKADDCFTAAATALTEHGFVKQPGEIRVKDTHQAQFTAPGYAVIISTSTGKNGGCSLGYEVGQIPIAPSK